MRYNYLFIAAMLLYSYAYSQISIEKVYNVSTLERVNLEQSGEKYYTLDRTDKKLIIYNSDHTLWKSIDVAVPANKSILHVNNVSEKLFNTDNLIEFSVIFNEYDQVNEELIYSARIINETGQILLDKPNAYNILVNDVEGLDKKLIVHNKMNATTFNSDLYNIPGIQLFQTVNTGSNLGRVKLENSGETYFTTDFSSNKVHVFNADLTSRNVVNLNVPVNSELVSDPVLSEKLINDDNALEVAYTYNVKTSGSIDTYDGRIISETGSLISTVPQTAYFMVKSIQGLKPKLATVYNLTTNSYKILGSGSTGIEKDYTDVTYCERILLGANGEKYYTYRSDERKINLYNADHTIWKTINLNLPTGASNLTVTHVSDNIVNADPYIEVAYCYSSVVSGSRAYYCRIINDNGDVLLTDENATSLKVDQTKGLQYKIFANSANPVQVKVYNIPNVGKAGLQNSYSTNQVNVYPNPANDYAYITADNLNVAEAQLYNLQGKLVSKLEIESDGKILLCNAAEGLYFVKLITDTKEEILTKLSVKH